MVDALAAPAEAAVSAWVSVGVVTALSTTLVGVELAEVTGLATATGSVSAAVRESLLDSTADESGASSPGVSGVFGIAAGTSAGGGVGSPLASASADVSGLADVVDVSAFDESDEESDVVSAWDSGSDVDELVCAPPELWTVPEGESCDDPPDELVESDDEAEADESDEVDESASEGSATATHGFAATAAPTPSATASAPTRPMYLALPIAVPLCATQFATDIVPQVTSMHMSIGLLKFFHRPGAGYTRYWSCTA